MVQNIKSTSVIDIDKLLSRIQAESKFVSKFCMSMLYSENQFILEYLQKFQNEEYKAIVKTISQFIDDTPSEVISTWDNADLHSNVFDYLRKNHVETILIVEDIIKRISLKHTQPLFFYIYMIKSVIVPSKRKRKQ